MKIHENLNLNENHAKTINLGEMVEWIVSRPRKMLISQQYLILATELEFSSLVRYANYLICTFININENNKK